MSQGIYLSDVPVRRPQSSGNPLYRKIQRACRTTLAEPDLGLNLDVADYINSKQGGTAFDAVTAIVKLINNRDTHTAVFALSLLDVLVKNCGYPVHLQISRKEFLNELVKRFPEHPPLRYSKVQRLILTAIEEWYQTICKHSSYKDDLNYIRDMRRLLKYKGYSFPRIQAEDLAVMRPTDQLKTPKELQKEQEIAQAAKLEELIRSGTPRDLKEANKLMKVMAGFKEDNAVQVKESINSELNKLKHKADLLNEMISTNNKSDSINETTEELYGALKGAQPKFQKIIEEEHDDDDLVQQLLKFNDTVNQLVEKYTLIKGGNQNAAQSIHPAIMTDHAFSSANNNGALANEINLIDFGDDLGSTSPSPTPNPYPNSNGVNTSTTQPQIDDVMDLLGDLNVTSDSKSQSLGIGGGISLPTESNNNASALSSSLLDDLMSPSSNETKHEIQSANRTLVSESSDLKIEFVIARENDTSIKIKIFFSNVSSNNLTDVKFSLAVPKSMRLALHPQTTNILNGGVADGIVQDALIDNALKSAIKPLKVKWMVNYKINATEKEETAVFVLPQV